MNRAFKICQRCVMDTTDLNIEFDSAGICNHCKSYTQLKVHWPLEFDLKEKTLEKHFSEIKKDGKGKEWDCLIGLSGGVDSSYIAYLAHQHGLRPLCVHLDNGWNSELATANIHGIVSKLGFELHTHVIDWEEFKDLQKAFFKAHVVDIEMLSDHAIFGVILKLARKYNLKHILSGANHSTEAIMPKAWVHRKSDERNIKSIHSQFGSKKIKTFPFVSTLEHVFYMYGIGYRVHKPLNWIDYNKARAKEVLMRELGWRDYGGKHYESIFTKFYQAHILPVKFNIDKRKAHLSTLINSEQISREEALTELQKPLYNTQELESDTEYVCKKLSFSAQEFKDYLKGPPVAHSSYGSDQPIYDILYWIRENIARHT